MSILIIIGDGMADEPLPQLQQRTPLQVACTPNMDFLATHGWNGLIQTVPNQWEVGSDVACLSILGYDLQKTYQGRSIFEAASLNIPVAPHEMVMRCNLISIQHNHIQSFTADHIPTSEAQQLITKLNSCLGTESLQFYVGNTYRHLLKLKGSSKGISCLSPHNAIQLSKDHLLLQARTTEATPLVSKLNHLIIESQQILANHPINIQRQASGKLPANSISLWAPASPPNMPPLNTLYSLKKGAVISATDLIKGIGHYAGLEVIKVDGATGRFDTNYKGKAEATLEALQNNDFVLLHIEASDEASHDGDYALKIKTIEDLDKQIIQPIINETNTWSHPPLIALLPDHPTSSQTRVHLSDPVPYAIYHRDANKNNPTTFEERIPNQTTLQPLRDNDFMNLLIKLQDHIHNS